MCWAVGETTRHSGETIFMHHLRRVVASANLLLFQIWASQFQLWCLLDWHFWRFEVFLYFREPDQIWPNPDSESTIRLWSTILGCSYRVSSRLAKDKARSEKPRWRPAWPNATGWFEYEESNGGTSEKNVLELQELYIEPMAYGGYTLESLNIIKLYKQTFT